MQLIGRYELVSLPVFGLENLQAKVDTGAYTSSLHCHQTEEVTQPDGSTVLRARLLDPSWKEAYRPDAIFERYSVTHVTSSNGVRQKRFKVRTKLKLGTKTYSVDLTLADRKKMDFPMLLGRKLLTGRFLVDVALAYALNPAEAPEHSPA